MKKFLFVFLVFSVAFACKEKNTVDGSRPLSERLPGTWYVAEIQYSGTAPHPTDTAQVLSFSGSGKNVGGYFYFDNDTNLGEFDLQFIAEADLGLSQPIQYNVNEKREGFYEILPNDAYVRMTNMAQDSTYDWEVRTNLESRQKWFTTMYHNWGLPGMDSVAIDIEVVMTR